MQKQNDLYKVSHKYLKCNIFVEKYWIKILKVQWLLKKSKPLPVPYKTGLKELFAKTRWFWRPVGPIRWVLNMSQIFPMTANQDPYVHTRSYWQTDQMCLRLNVHFSCTSLLLLRLILLWISTFLISSSTMRIYFEAFMFVLLLSSLLNWDYPSL